MGYTASSTNCPSNSLWLCASAPLREALLFLLLCLPLQAQEVVRIATFNASLHGRDRDDLFQRVARADDEQALRIASIIKAVNPDVLLINEFDAEPAIAGQTFSSGYLDKAYPFVYAPQVNTGVPSGADLNGDGETQGAADAHGWGEYPGQYGMLVLSRHPIASRAIREFRQVAWAMQPGSRMPRGYYSEHAAAVMHLSSKNHVDVPVRVGDRVIHLLISHPTPPVFDGPEDRNGLRNFDEIRLWADYLTPGRAGYLGGHLPEAAAFVLLGDLNADPHDGESAPGAIRQLLEHPRVQDPRPTSRGAVLDAEADGGINAQHTGDPALDTADFSEGRHGPGNLRVDYVLPSRNLQVVASGVYWPAPGEPGHDWLDASDHRLVWVDVRLPVEHGEGADAHDAAPGADAPR